MLGLCRCWLTLVQDTHTNCPNARAGSTAWVLCGNQVATKYMGMRIGRKYPLTLGGVDTCLLKYEVLARVARSKQLVTQ